MKKILDSFFVEFEISEHRSRLGIRQGAPQERSSRKEALKKNENRKNKNEIRKKTFSILNISVLCFFFFNFRKELFPERTERKNQSMFVLSIKTSFKEIED